jgi:hypothetical protein
LIPTVTIVRNEVTQVVEIFERINSTGTRLNAIDFMRALTWSSDFDLSIEIHQLQDIFIQNGYFFEPETLVKTMAITLNKAPIPEEMLKLKNYTADQLHEAIRNTYHILNNVIVFLKENFKILSSEFISLRRTNTYTCKTIFVI